MIDFKALREASERLIRAEKAWRNTLHGEDEKETLELEVARLQFSFLAKAFTRALLSGDWPEEAVEAGQEAYRQGYRDGFVDGRNPEGCDDEELEHRRMDGVAMSDGWSNYRDTFLAALRAAVGGEK